MRKYLLLIPILPLLTSCYNSDLEFEDQYKTVVESYIYAERSSAQLILTSMITFGSDSTSGEAIEDATVVLEGPSSSHTFIHNDSVSGQYDLASLPVFSPGESYKLSVEVDGEFIEAYTIVPEDPPAVTMSTNTIYIEKVDDPRDYAEIDMPDPVELSWDNPDADYYFLDIQNIESNPSSIMPDPPDDRPFENDRFAFQMITEPTNDNYYEIQTMQLTHYGTHRVIMTSINDEYTYLYNTLEQDSRELNEPYSNIENGLGIFTAFNSDTLYLEVKPS